ncbi:5-Formyltetrahydrofolate cycloligase [Haematococcus lacustris]
MASVYELKRAIRTSIKSALKTLGGDTMQRESQAIAGQVIASSYFKRASALCIYVHCAKLREVDTTAILDAAYESGKRCYVPLVADRAANMKLLHLENLAELRAVPPFGILEPDPCYPEGHPREEALDHPGGLDLVILPGLGFDTQGRRLGRGGGYYDKALAALRSRAAEACRPPPLLVALAYGVQVRGDIPVDQHDQEVDILVTADASRPCSLRGKEALLAK